MKRPDLDFERPPELAAVAPPEARGLARDEVRLLVTTPQGHTHARFRDLPHFLRSGDLLVVNDSATLPASLPARGEVGPFTLNLSTHYGDGLWLAEPRWRPDLPGPLPLESGDSFQAGDLPARFVALYPGLPRLWFVQVDGDLGRTLRCQGQPIRYGYVPQSYPLEMYQTIFSATPGSAEMPSAARPFTWEVVAILRRQGVQIASITLHTGVSSLDIEADDIEEQPLYPEPFRVPSATAHAISQTRQQGGRIIAVGTTVARAVESAWCGNGEEVRPVQGFTRLYIHPGRGVNVVDGLLTGLHEPVTTHLAILYALIGQEATREAYREAVWNGYLWHEFGDSHLIMTR